MALVIGAGLTGCGGKSVSDIAGDIKKAATQTADKAKETAQSITPSAQSVTTKAAEAVALAGSMELTLDAPLKTGACYAQWLSLPGGRPSVLQLQSYREAAQESFPSAFVRAQVSAGTVAKLKGQTVPAELFVQPQKDGPTWSTRGELVQLKIVSVEAKTLTAEIVGGALSNDATGVTQTVKGTLQGVLP
jgi:hypothetical protein